MRQIKFRAWDHHLQQMNYKVLVGNTDADDPNYTCNAVLGEKGWVNADEKCIDIMQSTGLFDSNGREIYELDIKREERPTALGDIRNYFVCTWIAEWCRFAWLELEEYLTYKEIGDVNALDNTLQETYGIFVDEQNVTTVVGNVYDNPEIFNYGYGQDDDEIPD